MAGAIIHLLAAVLCFMSVYIINKKYEYGLSIFIGNFIPDVIKIGISAILQSTVDIFDIKTDSSYFILNHMTSNLTNWFTLGFFVIGTCALLYHFHYIKKKTMEEYDELYGFLLAGIIIHLIMDTFIAETGFWF